MKRLIILAAAMLLAGCIKAPEEAQHDWRDFAVEKLFTHDGCTVYRFLDGSYRYFTNCKGRTEWTESCGKNCSREQSVDGQQ